MAKRTNIPQTPWRQRLHDIIFEADTPAGKLFDVALIWAIILSVVVVMLDSVSWIHVKYEHLLSGLEWTFTILFSIEYIFRVLAVRKARSYVLSFMGIIDLLSILPTFLGLFLEGTEYLVVIRALRILRVFRILKLTRFIGEADALTNALKASRYKIGVFVSFILIVVVIMGALMYVVEGKSNGFTDIPTSVYWAIVTLTTVGYGDISPSTPVGQFISAIIMIMGYGVLAVPTGIIGLEFNNQVKHANNTISCPNCMEDEHLDKAVYCHSCGSQLDD